MSANNYLLITDTDPPCGDYELTEHDADTGERLGKIIALNGDLKELIKTATALPQPIEYGLHFNI